MESKPSPRPGLVSMTRLGQIVLSGVYSHKIQEVFRKIQERLELAFKQIPRCAAKHRAPCRSARRFAPWTNSTVAARVVLGFCYPHEKEVSMYRATGPGKVDVLFEAAAANILEARLYNFDFDDFEGRKYRPLKAEHSKFLADRVVPLLQNDSGNIWMQGSASRIGPGDWNMVLSQVRQGTVWMFLVDRKIKAEQIELNAVGDTLAVHHALDDPHDRGLLISVHPKVKKPPLPKKIPPRPKINNRFKIAVDGKFPPRWAPHHDYNSLGEKILKKIIKKIPVSYSDLPFIIWDVENSLA